MTRATPMIVVDQQVALFDTPIAIVLEHLAPGTPATITATSEMWGRVWRSHATVVADDAKVRLAWRTEVIRPLRALCDEPGEEESENAA